ncbi:NAD(P)-binding protein [Dichomitus squalens LYAD-421 SS1]|uniref:NAD(P)-binding protein n=1 Tax=Dichomitus squalens (strain LYAD-421) TaxID=732165 RepID=UPI0004410DBD|nr:NAD(P)-binding protein [Dichomitus squalens LYAD-421 SS1]EJF65172.1 NAD(P)-binding protein [Dichomitus squalens LYAD-421 SS1]
MAYAHVCASTIPHIPPKAKWGVSDMPNLSGKVMIVTGGNTGIGKETVKALLSHGAKVYMAARNETKAQAAIAELCRETGREAIFLRLDLADLQSVKAAAREFLSKESKLDVLFNSGGIMFPPVEQLTADGYDLQFGTNVLGHFYLTQLLIPVLLSGASHSPDGHARVINTSSVGHAFVSGIDFDTLRESAKRKKLGTHKLHFQSKFATVVFSNELQRRYGDQGIVSVSLHPGNLKTNLQRHVSSVEKVLTAPLLYPASMGALTQLWAGTSPEGLGLGGGYLVPWARRGTAREETQDGQLGKKLWAWMEKHTGDV